MAEARQAVGFRLGVTPDGGISFEYDHDVVDLILKGFKRTWTKSLARLMTGVKTGLFPFKIEVFCAKIAILTAVFLAGYDPTLGLSEALVSWLKINDGIAWVAYCVMLALLTALFWTGVIRFSLRLLFSYQAWMFMSREELKNPPILHKAWQFLLLSLLEIRKFGSKTKSGKPMLLAYQGALPTLPLPKVADTLKRHLDSIKPFTDDAEFEKFVELSKEFEATLGAKLQRWLKLKWWTSDNYVSDWWEEYVYLRGRLSIMINSNYYCLDAIKALPTQVQSARAANVVNLAFKFRRLLLKQEAAPLIVQGAIPMCSRQYDRFFNTTRIPGVETDVLLHLNDSTHVAVMHKGRFFRLCCYSKGQLLNPAELQMQIQGIIDDDSLPDQGESHLGALTAAPRTTWANTREKYFNHGINKASLEVIEKAAFVLVLDDYAYNYDPQDEHQISHFGAMMLHGKAFDRWFDKSFQIMVGSNGRIGLNGEHSWADAPVVGHFWEFLLAHDINTQSYDCEGNCSGNVMQLPPKARKLRWEIPAECRGIVETCLKEAQLLVDDLHLHILFHDAYGKGFMKACKLSPDAYIQMALQLAYYRDAGRFCLTYEASMTRLFREGRTETVRSCTLDSVAWARSMEDSLISDSERINLLQKACARHQRGYQEAMTGSGIDRHLFALYVVSKYLDVDSEFLRRVLSEPWRLSTSQTPVRGEFGNVNKNPEMLSAGGGFGPVADDGYGVSYIITGEDCIFFHVSCKRRCELTDAYRFAKRIESALADMRSLFQRNS